MRNLRNLQHKVSYDSKNQRPSACTWDVKNDSIISIYGPSKDDHGVVHLKRWRHSAHTGRAEEVALIASWDSPPPSPDIEHDVVVSLKYFSDTELICVILEGGDIVVVREQPVDGENKIEIVGSVDSGISAATWSPDDELLALVTKDDTLLFMTREFDTVTSTLLHQDDLKASKHVSVGWGKSETQFKGKGAKALRDPTMPESVDEGLPSINEDNRTVLSWRGDGTYVAINSLQGSSRRVIRIFTREGVLDGVSEPVDNLESAISWRPIGNLISSIQRTETDVKVVFFERNGLRHGGFSLRLTPDQISQWGSFVELSWNAESTVLAVSYRDRLQLWTIGNYHDYLKQELVLTAPGSNGSTTTLWHPEQPLLLTTIASDGIIHQLEYVWHTCKGSTVPPNDNGTVAVIDGAQVKLTAFRLCNVPPPMAQIELALDEPAIDVGLWDKGRSAVSIAIVTSRSVYVYGWNIGEDDQEPPNLLLKQSFSELTDGTNNNHSHAWPQQIKIIDAFRVYILSTDGTKSTIALTKFDDGKDLVRQNVLEVAEAREMISYTSSEEDQCFLSLRKAEVVRVDEQGFEPLQTIPMSAVHSEVVSLAVKLDSSPPLSDHSHPRYITITLTKSGSLYADSRCLASNCTSFLTTSSHLVYTTSQHYLKFVHITSSSELEIPLDEPETDERCRSIERGARLVTVVPSLSITTLQMPRGNLETVYPRVLVLAEIRRHLLKGAYRKAYMYCRNHRVDMNILHDFNSTKFLSDVPRFMEQIPKAEHVDLFLAQLRNEDVSVTMYRETLKHNASSQTTNGTSDYRKVNNVCDAFLVELRKHRDARSQNIITAHCCKEPPDIESALREVSRMLVSDAQGVERAIEHICFLVDVNKLYDTALGLYDIGLTHLVAQQSQKDPREYLPFLQALRDQPNLRMRFDIDNHLGRYTKCLHHLQELDDFDLFKSFTLAHHLYDEAMSLCRRNEAQSKAVMQLYASFLSSTSGHGKAGVAYEYVGDYNAAAEAYRLAHMWQEALACAGLVSMAKDKLDQFAQSIAESLTELKSYHAAATIYHDYLDDVESTLRLFCKGYYFAEATRTAALHNRVDLLGTLVDAGLREGMSNMTELIADCKSQLNAQVPRIRELRTKKSEAPLTFFDADVNGDVNIPDNVSLAGTDASTSGGTLFTRYTSKTGTIASNTTRQTSKNRRREERKKARGKKGSVYEEEYLVNSVGRLFDRINSVNQEVARLVLGLWRRGMREQAMAVEGAMIAIIKMCNECRDEVFQVFVENDHGIDNTGVGDKAVVNGEETNGEVDTDQTQHHRAAPIVKAFDSLSLFGG